MKKSPYTPDAAENYYSLVAFLRYSEGWSTETIASCIKIGRGIRNRQNCN